MDESTFVGKGRAGTWNTPVRKRTLYRRHPTCAQSLFIADLHIHNHSTDPSSITGDIALACWEQRLGVSPMMLSNRLNALTGAVNDLSGKTAFRFLHHQTPQEHALMYECQWSTILFLISLRGAWILAKHSRGDTLRLLPFLISAIADGNPRSITHLSFHFFRRLLRLRARRFDRLERHQHFSLDI